MAKTVGSSTAATNAILSQRNDTAFKLIRAIFNLVPPPAATTLFLVGSFLLDC